MAQTRPAWVSYVAVAAIAFVVGRSCQDDPAPRPIALPVASPYSNPALSADLAAAEAAAAAGEAARAAGNAAPPAIRPIYSAPVYEPPAYTSFANCSEARGAGAAPVYAGDPGYGSHLDRDGDGVGCE
jgi:hypothetical protein